MREVSLLFRPSLARIEAIQHVVLAGDGRAVMHVDPLRLLGKGSEIDLSDGWMYAKRNITDTDWVVVGRQSDATIKAETLRSVWPVLGALGLSWLAALVISVFLARRMSRPISEISRGVEAFAAGQMDTRVQVDDQGEIARLAQQFNRMADVVQRSQEELEGLVAERTQDLAQANDQLAAWSKELEQRVADKLREVERLSELKRFFSPRLAESLVAEDRAQLLQSHRREATVMFVDLRGFTAFAEAAPADRVMAVLREFHAEAGRLIFEFEGTLERFTGDGMMVFFNDPDPMPDHAGRAVALACRLRDRAAALMQGWQAEGVGPSGVGIGLSLGQATIGPIGFESRVDYAAIGTVTNRAARLCAEAAAGEVLICSALHERLQGRLRLGATRQAQLKGLQAPETCYAVEAIDPLTTSAPAAAG